MAKAGKRVARNDGNSMKLQLPTAGRPAACRQDHIAQSLAWAWCSGARRMARTFIGHAEFDPRERVVLWYPS